MGNPLLSIETSAQGCFRALKAKSKFLVFLKLIVVFESAIHCPVLLSSPPNANKFAVRRPMWSPARSPKSTPDSAAVRRPQSTTWWLGFCHVPRQWKFTTGVAIDGLRSRYKVAHLPCFPTVSRLNKVLQRFEPRTSK